MLFICTEHVAECVSLGCVAWSPAARAVLSSQPVVVGQHWPRDGCGCVTPASPVPPAMLGGGSGPSSSVNGGAADGFLCDSTKLSPGYASRVSKELIALCLN